MQGTLLDERYLLLERIGSGGMGTVWRARDKRLGREVAVKTLGAFELLGDDSGGVARRFQREAALAGRLSSPHIVTVHDSGRAEVDGRSILYLVMELLRGQSLDRRLRAGLPPLAEVAAWTAQICEALAVAHAGGVVHRDLKPANVWLGEDGRVKVLDFGIARFVHDTVGHTRLTLTGAVVGTPAYMSPEQAAGADEARPVDERSDLYSLGCMLYEMVTGGPPFRSGSVLALLAAHAREAPRAPRELRPELPARWDALISELLVKDPAGRPESASAVRLLLDGAPTVQADRADAEAPAGVAARALPSPGANPERAEGEAGPSAATSADEQDWYPRRPDNAGTRRELLRKARARVALRGELPPGALTVREQRALRVAGSLSLACWVGVALGLGGHADLVIAVPALSGAALLLGLAVLPRLTRYVPSDTDPMRDFMWLVLTGMVTVPVSAFAGVAASPPSSVFVFLQQAVWLLGYPVLVSVVMFFVAVAARGEPDHVPRRSGVVSVERVQPGMVAVVVGWASGMVTAGSMLAGERTWWIAIVTGGCVWLVSAATTAWVGSAARRRALRRNA